MKFHKIEANQNMQNGDIELLPNCLERAKMKFTYHVPKELTKKGMLWYIQPGFLGIYTRNGNIFHFGNGKISLTNSKPDIVGWNTEVFSKS